MNRNQGISLTATKLVFGVSMAVGLALHTPPAIAAPISDDDPNWSCVDSGNRVCGPGNSNGVTAGCYGDGGVLVAVWPCEAWKPSDGYRHADGTVSY